VKARMTLVVLAALLVGGCSNPGVPVVATLGPTPTPTAVPTPTPIPLDVKRNSMTSPVAHGDRATLTISTAAGADCKIVVEYASGPSQAAGLGEKTADADGAVSWTWTVGQTTKAGRYPITVTCFKENREGTLEVTFEVT
jgi:hypothetical protein